MQQYYTEEGFLVSGDNLDHLRKADDPVIHNAKNEYKENEMKTLGTNDITSVDIVTKWSDRFMALAEHVAQWSKDPSTKVGAVITDDMKRVLGIGYNGFPRDVKDTDDRYNDRQTKYKFVVHAEANAILNCAPSERMKILIVTHPPCHECAKLIIQAGIKVVITKLPSEDLALRYADSYATTEDMFNEAGIIRYYME